MSAFEGSTSAWNARTSLSSHRPGVSTARRTPAAHAQPTKRQLREPTPSTDTTPGTPPASTAPTRVDRSTANMPGSRQRAPTPGVDRSTDTSGTRPADPNDGATPRADTLHRHHTRDTANEHSANASRPLDCQHARIPPAGAATPRVDHSMDTTSPDTASGGRPGNSASRPSDRPHARTHAAGVATPVPTARRTTRRRSQRGHGARPRVGVSIARRTGNRWMQRARGARRVRMFTVEGATHRASRPSQPSSLGRHRAGLTSSGGLLSRRRPPR